MEDSEILEKGETKDASLSKTIKHIVIPGGGGTGFIAYGALKESHNRGIWNIENIESIYGTSAGAIIAIFIAIIYSNCCW